jgi:hypothetical protein
VNRANIKIIARLAAPAALALLAAGCMVVTDNPRSAERISQTIDLKGAKSVQMNVEMGAGELQMQGGAATLMDADFRYSGSDAKPDVKYDLSAARGTLSVRQPSHHHIGSNSKNEWTLRLNEEVPMDISVKLGAGEGRLNLGQLALRSVDVEVGAGEIKLDLTGQPRNNVDVRVRGGVGEATIRLPRRARIEVEAHGGLGEISAHGLTKRGDLWVNEPAGESDATIHVNVAGGIGGINLFCE